jgi:hypothetical protein
MTASDSSRTRLVINQNADGAHRSMAPEEPKGGEVALHAQRFHSLTIEPDADRPHR